MIRGCRVCAICWSRQPSSETRQRTKQKVAKVKLVITASSAGWLSSSVGIAGAGEKKPRCFVNTTCDSSASEDCLYCFSPSPCYPDLNPCKMLSGIAPSDCHRVHLRKPISECSAKPEHHDSESNLRTDVYMQNTCWLL